MLQSGAAGSKMTAATCGPKRDFIAVDDSLTSQRRDLAVLRQKLDTSIRGVGDLTRILVHGTEEIKNYLLHGCEVVLECCTCRNLFRSVANFTIHKRCYCKELTIRKCAANGDNCDNSNDDDGDGDGGETQDQAATNGMMIVTEPVDEIEADKQRDKKDKKVRKLETIVNFLKRKTGTDTVAAQTPAAGTSNEPMLILESVAPTNRVAMYQTLVENVDLTKKEAFEMHAMLENDVVVLDATGKIIDRGDLQRKASDKHETATRTYRHFQCKKCQMKFLTYRTYLIHNRFAHNESRYVYQCPCCRQSFPRAFSVYRHLSDAHKKSANQIQKARRLVLRSRIQWKSLRMRKRRSAADLAMEGRACAASAAAATAAFSGLGGGMGTGAGVSQMLTKNSERAFLFDFEQIRDLNRCSLCGKRFERIAALKSHSKMCKKASVTLQRQKNRKAAVAAATKPAAAAESESMPGPQQPSTSQTTLEPTAKDHQNEKTTTATAATTSPPEKTKKRRKGRQPSSEQLQQSAAPATTTANEPKSNNHEPIPKTIISLKPIPASKMIMEPQAQQQQQQPKSTNCPKLTPMSILTLALPKSTTISTIVSPVPTTTTTTTTTTLPTSQPQNQLSITKEVTTTGATGTSAETVTSALSSTATSETVTNDSTGNRTTRTGSQQVPLPKLLPRLTSSSKATLTPLTPSSSPPPPPPLTPATTTSTKLSQSADSIVTPGSRVDSHPPPVHFRTYSNERKIVFKRSHSDNRVKTAAMTATAQTVLPKRKRSSKKQQHSTSDTSGQTSNGTGNGPVAVPQSIKDLSPPAVTPESQSLTTTITTTAATTTTATTIPSSLLAVAVSKPSKPPQPNKKLEKKMKEMVFNVIFGGEDNVPVTSPDLSSTASNSGSGSASISASTSDLKLSTCDTANHVQNWSRDNTVTDAAAAVARKRLNDNHDSANDRAAIFAAAAATDTNRPVINTDNEIRVTDTVQLNHQQHSIAYTINSAVEYQPLLSEHATNKKQLKLSSATTTATATATATSTLTASLTVAAPAVSATVPSSRPVRNRTTKFNSDFIYDDDEFNPFQAVRSII